jgi:hypothetical protein
MGEFPTSSLILILGIIIGTIIVALVLYLIVRVLESEHKAKDKIWMIVIEAFIAVFVLPIILGAIASVLGEIGNLLADLRNALDDGGANYLIMLTPIFGFLILLVLTKFLIDVPWDNALWISLVLLFVLYIIYCLVPELYDLLQVG